MKSKLMRRKSFVTLTIFCLSLLSLYGFVLTNNLSGTRVAEAAVTSWNIGTDGDLLITSGGEYYVTGSTVVNIIKVNTNDPVIITLENVSIDVSGIAGECAFDSGADVTVWLKGTNVLKSGDFTSAGILGQPGLKVQNDDCLVIYEDTESAGLLTATGGNRGAGIGGECGKDGGSVTIESGTVTAVGGLFAAGIGGGGDVWVNNNYTAPGGAAGLLTVNGGSVTATGGMQGAGIGSGAGQSGVEIVETGETRINGGTVTATGGLAGAGIGGGARRSNSVLFISGGIVTATGGDYAAGVGGGNDGSGGAVTIKGGELTANGGSIGAGIGGGNHGSGAVVEIEDAIVSAQGGESGAGIGSGPGYGTAAGLEAVNAGTVRIISGTVTAAGGKGGAGIGGGWRNNGAQVTIDGGIIKATGGAEAAGIGGGVSVIQHGVPNVITRGGNLTVNEGAVKAYGGQYSAGIGGSYWGSGAEVVINDGSVEAYGSGWGAGIGSGAYGADYGTTGTLAINGGYVKAIGGEDAAGIGGGYLRPGGTVTVSGGEVIAQGGNYGAGIGGGREKAGGNVTISGGSITATGGNFSAGIGGGAYGLGGTVTISNGTVTATGGTGGAGIGAGLNSPGGSVTITGGSIKAVGNNSDGIGGSGGAKGTGTLTNGTEPLELRILENAVAEQNPDLVNIQLTVTRSTPHDYSYVYNYAGKGHGDGDPDLYFYLPVRIATSLSLASSQNPSTWGGAVTLTAGLNTAAATGTVNFFDGDVLLGAATLNNGQAVFETAALAPGAHALRAKYQGNDFYAPSTTADLNQTVNKLPTSVALSSETNPAAIGAVVTFTATVDPAAASGQVKFYDGATLLETLNLVDGTAVLTTDDLTLGTHSIKAAYLGDEYYAAGDSDVVGQEIIKVLTVITLNSSRNPSAFGESVVFTATLDPLSAGGSIDFYDNGVWIGRTPISEGNALFATYYSLTLGSHSITAEYAGSDIYAASISNAFKQSVQSGPIDDPVGTGAELAALSATGISLTPAFSSEVMSYSATVKNSISTTTITAEPADNAATVKINGSPVKTKAIDLSIGKNLVAVQVTAADGVTTATYIIEITRASSGSDGGGGGGGGGGALTGYPIYTTGSTLGKYSTVFDIPAGAVSADTRGDIGRLNPDQADAPKGSVILGYIYELTKKAGGDFQKPVTVTLPFSRDGGELDKYALSIYRFEEDQDLWVELDNVAIDEKSISGETDKTGRFAVIAAEKPAATPKPPVSPQPAELTDLTGHWAETAIRSLVGSGAISGYPDHTFKPQQTITRAEFATVLAKAFKLEQAAGSGKVFEDTVGHWAKDYIAAVYAAGIIEGYSQQQFGADDPITREQMAVMIAKASKLPAESGQLNFTDSSKVSAWAYEWVYSAVNNQLMNGYQDQTFRPQANATRAEAVTVIYNALHL